MALTVYIMVGFIILFIIVMCLITRGIAKENLILHLVVKVKETEVKSYLAEIDKLKIAIDNCTEKMRAYNEMKGELDGENSR